MTRLDIIKTIGEQYLVSNIENGEFSYAKALQEVGKNHLHYIKETASRKYRNLDLRFIEGDFSF